MRKWRGEETGCSRGKQNEIGKQASFAKHHTTKLTLAEPFHILKTNEYCTPFSGNS